MPELESLLRHYGYAFLLVGSLVEGETTVALAGLAAHQGYMNIIAVIAVTTVGATLGDQFWFHIGRYRGKAFLERRPKWKPAIERFEVLFARWDVVFILGFRFLYGMRLAGAVAMGTSTVSTLKFTVFNVLGALIWASLIGYGGYLLGNAMEKLLGDIISYEQWIFPSLLVLGGGVWIWRTIRRRRAAKA